MVSRETRVRRLARVGVSERTEQAKETVVSGCGSLWRVQEDREQTTVKQGTVTVASMKGV